MSTISQSKAVVFIVVAIDTYYGLGLVLYMKFFYLLGQNIVFVKYFISQGYRKFFLGALCMPADMSLSPL
jgi:hypothetical protein